MDLDRNARQRAAGVARDAAVAVRDAFGWRADDRHCRALSATAQAQRTITLGAAKRTSAITVPVGKSEDVRTDSPFVDISVGDAEIADVNPLTDKALSILGKKIGTTRVSIYGEGKKLIGVFDVEVSYDVSKLAEELARRFPHAKMRVSVGQRPHHAVGLGAGRYRARSRACRLRKQFGPEVINSVQVASPQQVMLEVRFIEASRSAGRELGVQWNVLPRPGHEDRFLANIGNRKAAGALPVTAGSSGGVLSINPGAAAAGVLQTATPPFGFLIGNLIYQGLAGRRDRQCARGTRSWPPAWPNPISSRCRAIPRTSLPAANIRSRCRARSARSRSTTSATASASRSRRRCLSDGMINLKIEPEVSQLDPNRSVAVGTNITVPALIVRRASSTIELRDGQSFVLGGLLQNDSQVAQEQLPWLGDIPVLGALFSSKAYQKNETDLVIIVTPRIVQPIRPGLPVRTPLDNTLPPNDVDLFVKGKGEIARKDLPPGAPERPFVGHMLDLPRGGTRVSMR